MSSPGRDRRVFVDTSAYFAAIDPRDASHLAAASAMRLLVDANHSLITTNFVLAELHALLLARMGRLVAVQTLVDLRVSQTIVRARASDEVRAEAILLQYDDKLFSYTDAVSFAVMERTSVSVAFALDHHFAQYGWTVVPTDRN